MIYILSFVLIVLGFVLGIAMTAYIEIQSVYEKKDADENENNASKAIWLYYAT